MNKKQQRSARKRQCQQEAAESAKRVQQSDFSTSTKTISQALTGRPAPIRDYQPLSLSSDATVPDGMVAIYDLENNRWVAVSKSSREWPLSMKILVTPRWADEVMRKRNTLNRKVERRRVKRYARDMIDGNWHIAADDICFYANGRLANGQHRLLSVVESNTSVLMAFKFGVEEAAIHAIDEGRTRSTSDVAKMQGIDAPAKLLSYTNYILEQGGVKEVLPRQSHISFFERHREAVEFVRRLKGTFGKSPIAAAIIRAYYNVADDDRSRLEEFINVLQEGKYRDDADSAAIRLRDFIMSGRKSARSGSEREDLYRRTENAVFHFLNRNPVNCLKVRSEELFLLPEEKLSGSLASAL